jgi:hypothetical protein
MCFSRVANRVLLIIYPGMVYVKPAVLIRLPQEEDVWSIATLTQITQTEQRAGNFKEMKTIWTDLAPRM